jgi:hypothetical protein
MHSLFVIKSSSISGDSNCSEIDIFENERFRFLIWSSRWLRESDPTRYSDEGGTIKTNFSSLNSIPCPAGWTWTSDWMINKDYTCCSAEGWSYATSFARLTAKYAANCSTSRPTLRQVVRRRLWRRLITKQDEFLPSLSLVSVTV